MRRTKVKLPRAGDKEKVELQSTEDTIDSTSKRVTKIKRLSLFMNAKRVDCNSILVNRL
jgi:hypothetical protein